ncbi:MAG: helix-turn-helix domain-containing protein [Bacteriovoracaceae bacterium]
MPNRRTEKELIQQSPLAAFVKIHRKQLGLDQEEFALRVGVGLAFLKRLESGKTNLQYAKILQVLEFFEATLIPTLKASLNTHNETE